MTPNVFFLLIDFFQPWISEKYPLFVLPRNSLLFSCFSVFHVTACYMHSTVSVLCPPFLGTKCSLWPGLAGIIPNAFLRKCPFGDIEESKHT